MENWNKKIEIGKLSKKEKEKMEENVNVIENGEIEKGKMLYILCGGVIEESDIKLMLKYLPDDFLRRVFEIVKKTK